ncbi:MAG: glycoside hydrolase family 130 protein [Kiritimatiellales bacterium]|nr:glycoside hydrolase family 130 protein [Kiritimatiellales bacterium]
MNSIHIDRTKIVLHPDPTRVLLRPFLQTGDRRAMKLCAQVMALSDRDVDALWKQVKTEFGSRHAKIEEFLLQRFSRVRACLHPGQKLSKERKLLLGSYFSHEYSLEASALFNPSMVPHPDQSDLPAGSLRFILSLRATGEGHISSVTFRTGVLDKKSGITITDPTRYCLEPAQIPNTAYHKPIFERKLQELGLAGSLSRHVLDGLENSFTQDELRTRVQEAVKDRPMQDRKAHTAAAKIMLLAQANYEVQFDADSRPSERVLFPSTPSQSNGIEDARFVLFKHDDGTQNYCATYTAYDGKMVLPQFIETADFLHFKFSTLNGPAVQNKGMALFPRKINGRYVMMGRQDAENIYVLFSDNLHFWNTSQLILKPKFPWEFIQIGNCGSPIETEAGWLVLSHGVGPMRKYCIGAFLLDLNDPTKVIGRLREPLITPDENEREGYVPNVVYSCGSLIHNSRLILPYAMSDYATTFATLSRDELLAAME